MTHTMDAGKYLKICIALLLLTALTIAQPYILPSSVSSTVGMQMIIALIKTFLIVLYYMHLKYESKLTIWIVYGALFVFVATFALIASDIIYRHQIFDVYGF